MKQYSTVILLVLSSLFAQGQGLTTGEVYDFEVGDVFQTRSSSGASYPPIFYTRTIESKTEYPTGDSVNYMIHLVTYAPYSGPGQTAVITYSDISQTYFALSSPVWEPQTGPDCFVEDTTYTASEFCGRTVWENHSGDSCVGPVYWTSMYIQGCGGPFLDSYNDGTNQVSQLLLIYYKKGELQCGTLNENATGIPEKIAERSEVVIYPVPSSDRVTLQLADVNLLFSVQVELIISDTQGRSLKRAVVHASEIAGLQLDIHDLPTGLFMLTLAINGRVLTRGRFVKI